MLGFGPAAIVVLVVPIGFIEGDDGIGDEMRTALASIDETTFVEKVDGPGSPVKEESTGEGGHADATTGTASVELVVFECENGENDAGLIEAIVGFRVISEVDVEPSKSSG